MNKHDDDEDKKDEEPIIKVVPSQEEGQDAP